MKITREDLMRFAELGVGTSLYQLSAPSSWDLGLSPNQWQETSYYAQALAPKILNHASAWMTMEKYLPILARMGFKKLRFSVEWNYIEPQEGVFNQAAVNQYRNFIYACLQQGIEPMLTLYHFTQPLWFKNKGGFENPENISCYVKYAGFILKNLGSLVNYWCTFNEPAIEAFLGYFLGLFPPHHRISFNQGAEVLKNMLQAHIEVCAEIMKNSPKSHFGLVHNFLQFESQIGIVDHYLAKPLSHFTNDIILEFMHTGKFNYHEVKFSDSRCRGNSFFVNIYGNVQIGLLGPTCQKGQKMGDMHLALYPQSYQQALTVCSELGLPIFITETGFADETDVNRSEFIIEFLRVVVAQIAGGMDIKGLYYWTFKDNYEWNQGNLKQFGIFNLEDEPKNSAYLFTWILHNFQKAVQSNYVPSEIIAQWNTILDHAQQKLQEQDFLFFKMFATEVGVIHK